MGLSVQTLPTAQHRGPGANHLHFTGGRQTPGSLGAMDCHPSSHPTAQTACPRVNSQLSDGPHHTSSRPVPPPAQALKTAHAPQLLSLCLDCAPSRAMPAPAWHCSFRTQARWLLGKPYLTCRARGHTPGPVLPLPPRMHLHTGESPGEGGDRVCPWLGPHGRRWGPLMRRGASCNSGCDTSLSSPLLSPCLVPRVSPCALRHWLCCCACPAGGPRATAPYTVHTMV